MNSRAIIVIVNAHAGKPSMDDIGTRITAAFNQHGLAAEVLLAASGEEIAAHAREAMRAKPTCVVAGGGDGTISAVASHLVDTPVTLGVLPLGTLNHFAKDLGLPQELDAAVANIAAGRVATVDVGTVNERVFLNNSSLGLYPRLVRMREQQQETLGRGKWPAFVWAAFLVLRRFAFVSVELDVDGVRVVRRAPLVFIGNNQYAVKGLDIGSRERLDRGELSLYIPRALTRWGLLRMGLRALLGLAPEIDFEAATATTIRIASRRATLHVAADGEVETMSTPLNYAIHPRALKVIVPDDPSPARAD